MSQTRNRDRGKQGAQRKYTVRSGESGARLRLSALDTITGALYTDRILYFRETLDGAALRESLARTMRHYPALSGRLERDTDGRLSVACNDAGAAFVEEDSASTLTEHQNAPRGKPGRLLPQVPQFKMTGPDMPLLAVLLTHTSGGGTIMGVRMKHALVDARAFAIFVNNWSREHRGLSFPEPSHDRHMLDEVAAKAPPEAAETSDRFAVHSRRAKAGLLARIALNARKVTSVTSRLSRAETAALKEAAMRDLAGTDKWVSTNDAVSAHVWKVLGELRNRPDDAPESLGVIAQFSDIPEGALPETYWGNTITSMQPTMTAGELRSQPLSGVAHTIRQSLTEITADKMRDEVAFLLAQRAAGREKRVMPTMPFGAFSHNTQLNNQSKLPYYDIDFGDGTPVWCAVPDLAIPWMVHLLATPEKDDSLDVDITMPLSAAELFREESWQRRLHAYAPDRDGDG